MTKRAYQGLARSPINGDMKLGNKVLEERFKDINEAYEVISSDPDRRASDNT
jgi:DnaJ-class molecular chaperone